MTADIEALRPYQLDVLNRFDVELQAARRRILLVAPTGAGKTVLAASLVSRRGGSVLFLVHRRELLHQASRKLHAAGVDHGIIAADFPARPGERVQLASIATLSVRAIRSNITALPPADMVLIDEAHHASARSWRRLIDAYPNAIVIGLSATPCRGDGRGLGTIFEVMVECPSIADLISDGYLVGTTVYAPTKPDLAGVKVERGDYNETQLAERMDQPQLVGDVVTHYHRLAARRRTIVFACNLAHSVHLAGEFCRSGVVAEHLDGSTPTAERDAILRRFGYGITDVVVNVGVLTEGFDCPNVECIVLARPTKSHGLYRQIIGRGLRPAPGKSHCLVLDHAGATLEHGLIEEPIEWALSPDKRAVRPAQLARSQHRAPALAECPECTAVRWEGRPCTACGWRPRPKPAAVDVADGELGEVDRSRAVCRQSPTSADKLRFFAELLWVARERGYAPGWAAHKHREKFGTWPATRFASPVEPRPQTRSWVRSRFIAYARSRAKAGAAR
jgi:DNA repair protein RadD